MKSKKKYQSKSQDVNITTVLTLFSFFYNVKLIVHGWVLSYHKLLVKTELYINCIIFNIQASIVNNNKKSFKKVLPKSDSTYHGGKLLWLLIYKK